MRFIDGVHHQTRLWWAKFRSMFRRWVFGNPDQPQAAAPKDATPRAFLVPRTCREEARASGEALQPIAVEETRARDAYVLLGDPGIGKSATFRMEAQACGAAYYTARDFLTFDVPDLTGKTVFVDGLDEHRARASEGHSALDGIRAKLAKSGKPRFRISCREADWLGASDREALIAVAPGGSVHVFHLSPLTTEDVAAILAHDPYSLDGEQFIEAAKQHGLDDLLFNPQTLGILANAVQQDAWPATKAEAFELACTKMASESNAAHKTTVPLGAGGRSEMTHAAGALCAAYLLANLNGFALREDDLPKGFVDVRDIPLFNNLPAVQALKTRLFTASSEGLFAPIHRSVAEYLAARFVSAHVQNKKLPMERVLALMCGKDGRPVAALRGFNAWLAALHRDTRPRTVAKDPLGVVLYGDPSRYNADEKKHLFRELAKAAQENPAFRSENWAAQPFGALGTRDMLGFFETALASPQRDDAAQMYVDCILDVILHGKPMPELAARLLAIVHDTTHWPRVRKSALRAYAKQVPPSALVPLADAIELDQLPDEDDELLGILLRSVYPDAISPASVVRFLHAPKQENLIGSYLIFWDYHFAQRTTDGDLPSLLDALANSAFFAAEQALRRQRLGFGPIVGTLVVRALSAPVPNLTIAQIYAWLGLTHDRRGIVRVGEPHREAIVAWLGNHPDEHFALLRFAIEASRDLADPAFKFDAIVQRLHGAPPPKGIGRFWLEYADQEDSAERMAWFFERAMTALFKQGTDSDLTLEAAEAWVAERPHYTALYKAAIVCPIDDWWMEMRERDAANQEEEAQQRAVRHAQLCDKLPDLVAGSPTPGLLAQIARVYLGRSGTFHAETERERLTTYFCDDDALMSAGLDVLRAVPLRADIPTAEDIVGSEARIKGHPLLYPLLAGVALLHADDADLLAAVAPSVLKTALVFDWIAGHGQDLGWRTDLATRAPLLVAEAAILYCGKAFEVQDERVFGFYQLLNDSHFREVANHALPTLVGRFPARSRPMQAVSFLFDMLNTLAAITSSSVVLDLVEERLADGDLRATQRLCLLTAGLMQNPDAYLDPLRNLVANSRPRSMRFQQLLARANNSEAFRSSVATLTWIIGRLLPGSTPPPDDEDGFVARDLTESRMIRGFIHNLSQIPSREAATELATLRNLTTLPYWQRLLTDAQAAQRTVMREAGYDHPNVAQVSQTFLNLDPANALDLVQLLLVHLDDLAREISSGNADGYLSFWNVDSYGRAEKPRPENVCRDHLLELLKQRLSTLGVDAHREADYVHHKRADIRASYGTPVELFAIPVEIKRNAHGEVWHAALTQLDRQYARDPQSAGFGIYLVFWFGVQHTATPPAGVATPQSAPEMQQSLVRLLPAEDRERLFIRVIDCSGD